ncbi:hypothetical protein R1flu_012418 [Riccia fluitans]|uniref:Uncharacterized protein n=1 Tax=Riccia fluitans TaxID=41844 RepID=A0ABD1ZAN9_9MARC
MSVAMLSNMGIEVREEYQDEGATSRETEPGSQNAGCQSTPPGYGHGVPDATVVDRGYDEGTSWRQEESGLTTAGQKNVRPLRTVSPSRCGGTSAIDAPRKEPVQGSKKARARHAALPKCETQNTASPPYTSA